jgi:hypothetical protein
MRINLVMACVLALSPCLISGASATSAKHRAHRQPQIQSTPNGPYNPCLDPRVAAADPKIVCVAGAYAGSDSDPRIRASLAREFQFLNSSR